MRLFLNFSNESDRLIEGHLMFYWDNAIYRKFEKKSEKNQHGNFFRVLRMTDLNTCGKTEFFGTVQFLFEKKIICSKGTLCNFINVFGVKEAFCELEAPFLALRFSGKNIKKFFDVLVLWVSLPVFCGTTNLMNFSIFNKLGFGTWAGAELSRSRLV